MEAQIRLINVDDIIPNRFQPRLKFEDSALDELTTSIQEHGIFQPLVVRRLNDKYEIIAGERRYKAAQKAGLKAVPCIVSDIDDNESAEVAIIENTHRRNLSAIEEARAYKKLLDRRYLTQDQLARRLGMSQSTLSNKIRLLSLDDSVQKALINDQISERHARALLRVTDKMKQVELLNRIINESWTVKQLEDVVTAIVESYNKRDNTTGGINVNTKIDVDIDSILKNSTDIVSDLPNDGNLYYSYNSSVQAPPKKEKKNSIFFNNLENESVNMDPTLSFGFNPFKTQVNEETIDDDDDYDLLDLDDDDEEEAPTQTKTPEVVVQEVELEKNKDVITEIKKLLTKAKVNGLGVTSEEFSFDDIYQFVIRIDKEDK